MLAGIKELKMSSGQVVSNSELANSVTVSQVQKARITALLMGVSLLFVVGFASAAPLHNAAHDTRHAINFPCH